MDFQESITITFIDKDLEPSNVGEKAAFTRYVTTDVTKRRNLLVKFLICKRIFWYG